MLKLPNFQAAITTTIATELLENEAQQTPGSQPFQPQALTGRATIPSQAGSSTDSVIQPPVRPAAICHDMLYHLIDLLGAESQGLTVIWPRNGDRRLAIEARLAEFQDLDPVSVEPARPEASYVEHEDIPALEADGLVTAQACCRERPLFDGFELDSKRLRSSL